MSDHPTVLAAAFDALGRGDVGLAESLCRQGLSQRDDGELHAVVGMAAYAEDRYPEARHAWETAFRCLVRDGMQARAARVATMLAELCWDGLGRQATGRGWLERARRLLEDLGPCVEWGYWELARLACDRTDVEALAASADRALEIARAFDEPALHVRALADGGVALVSSGAVARGLAQLDEALAFIAAGEVNDPVVLGTAFCALLTAAERVGDVDRVSEWTDTVRELMLEPSGGRPVVLRSHCSIALGGVLVHAGRWAEAEELLTSSLAGRGPARASHRVDAVARLASLRVLQGRVDAAAELIAPYEDRLAVAVPLSAVHLARGEPALASAVAQKALDQLVRDTLRCAPLLLSLVDAAVAAGDPEGAGVAARRLRAMVEPAESAVVKAMAALAEGRAALAASDEAAAHHFEVAIRALETGERPDLWAAAHLDLARAHRAGGHRERAIASARAGHAAAVRLGAAPLRDHAASVLRGLGASPPRAAPDRAVAMRDLTAREREVLGGLRRGETNAQIAAQLFLSPKTVEHHVSRLLQKLGARSRAEAAALAASTDTLEGVRGQE
ncbi:MAG TPA: LuxR C-terminal-related transcriptional regulator [Acidimicrobiales bacterium]|nr:LuxR C-terminal-related transcriptional regulator [Acidimicrobiales bacterium]